VSLFTYGFIMGSFTSVLALAAMAAVVLVLIRGLWNMLRGGSGNTSNKLMQARIVLQAVAVALIMLTLWITGGGR
jgi:Hypoxia induced protein conserved region